EPAVAPIARLFEVAAGSDNGVRNGTAQGMLQMLAARVQSGEIKATLLARLREALVPLVHATLERGPTTPLYRDAAFLATTWKDERGFAAVRNVLQEADLPQDERLRAVSALIAAGDRGVVDAVARALDDHRLGSADFRGRLIASLGKLDDPRVAQ